MTSSIPIVIDPGTGLVKAGFACLDAPDLVFPSMVGRPRHLTPQNVRNEDIMVGDVAARKRSILTLRYPIERGMTTDWNDMELIWEHAYYGLRVDPNNHPLVLTEPAFNTAQNREKMTQLMFELFEVPALYVANQAVLPLYASGGMTGVVLDAGEGVSSIAPIYEGYGLPHTYSSFDVVGKDITDYLSKLLSEQGVTISTPSEKVCVRDIKEKLCYVSLNNGQGMAFEEQSDAGRPLEQVMGSMRLQEHTESYTFPNETTEPPTAPTSAFERFKALRRSHQRTGHKSHKKRYKDYLKRQPAVAAGTPPPPPPSEPSTASARHLQKLQKERERERSFSSHSPPIFAVGLRPQKPFYEGQVNYFDHHQLELEQEQQQQLEEDLKHRTEMERLIAHDNGNWYRRISPVLRNGVKTGGGETPKHHHHQHHHLGNHHHSHHNREQQQHHHQHHHTHHQKALRSRPSNPYQRKPAQSQNQGQSSTSSSPSSSPPPPPPPTPPLPPPKPQLGHQITELQHLERYYAKWPHLARVQFQVYDEHLREAHPELYGDDYEDDYETAAELEEAQQEHGEEANLPPYIKKYNRRNKQLLNLLEGTLPPPTSAPGGGSSTESLIRVDDDYLKEKRRRYHQHQQQQQQQQQHIDLFALQKVHPNTTEAPPRAETTTAGYIYVANGNVIQKLKLNDGVFKDEEYKDEIEEEHRVASGTTISTNQLPDEDVAALDSIEDHLETAPAGPALDYWKRELANKLMGSTTTSTPKPALFKLPSYPAIAGSFLGTPRSRSRSAQFVANVAGRGQSSWPRLDTVNATAEKPVGGENPPGGGGGGSGGRGAPSPLNSFVYHRVVDGIGIANGIGGGTGGAGSSRGKQSRLPFVAITDRRLDRSLGERHKDFEQNHYPMP